MAFFSPSLPPFLCYNLQCLTLLFGPEGRTLETSDAVKEKYLYVAKCINFPINKLIYLTTIADTCEAPTTFPEFGDTCKEEEKEEE